MAIVRSPSLTWPIGTRDDDMQTDGRSSVATTDNPAPLSVGTFAVTPDPEALSSGGTNSYPIGSN